MDSGMRRVIERFPELAPSIRNCFHGDQSFRDVCSDYAKALERWQTSDHPQKAARIEEYQELARALETEIVAALRLPTLAKDDRQS